MDGFLSLDAAHGKPIRRFADSPIRRPGTARIGSAQGLGSPAAPLRRSDLREARLSHLRIGDPPLNFRLCPRMKIPIDHSHQEP
jgi:hypothetical protein